MVGRALPAKALRKLILAAHLALVACGVQVDLKWGPYGAGGPVFVDVIVQSDGQKQTAQVAVSTGSPDLWFINRGDGPDGKMGEFLGMKPASNSSVGSPNEESSEKKPEESESKKRRTTLAETPLGLVVSGTMFKGALTVGNTQTMNQAPYVVRDLSWPSVIEEPLAQDGVLGLVVCPKESEKEKDKADTSNSSWTDEDRKGYWCHYWKEAKKADDSSDQNRNIWLGLTESEGAPELTMIVGEKFNKEIVKLAAPSSDANIPWSANLRAIGFSSERDKSAAMWRKEWNKDFNSPGIDEDNTETSVFEAASPHIVVSADIFQRVKHGLPDDCNRTGGEKEEHPSLECTCETDDDLKKFPTLTLSFETADNFRFWNIDGGSDHLVCIPPERYIRREGKICQIQIRDGGIPRYSQRARYSTRAGSVVLGMPFFRSVGVGFDAEDRVIVVSSTQDVGCKTTDPKNWLWTGRRISLRRIAVVLSVVTALALYIFVAHSKRPSAEWIRSRMRRTRENGGPLAARLAPDEVEVPSRENRRDTDVEVDAPSRENLSGPDVEAGVSAEDPPPVAHEVEARQSLAGMEREGPQAQGENAVELQDVRS